MGGGRRASVPVIEGAERIRGYPWEITKWNLLLHNVYNDQTETCESLLRFILLRFMLRDSCS